MLQDRPLDVKIKAPVRQLIPCFLFKRKLCHQPLLIHIEYLHVTFFFFYFLIKLKLLTFPKTHWHQHYKLSTESLSMRNILASHDQFEFGVIHIEMSREENTPCDL